MNKNLRFILTIILLGIFLTSYTYAASVTWTGGGTTSDWDDGANWSSGSEPATGDNVIISMAVTITGTATNTPARIRVWAAVVVTLDLDLTIAGTEHTVQLNNGGTLHFGDGVTARTFAISTTGLGSSGIILSNGGTNLVIASNSIVNITDGFNGVKVSGAGDVITNNGTINITNYRGSGIIVSDGTFNNNNIITINTPFTGSNNGVILDGASAIFNNNASGNITVTAALEHQFALNAGTTNNSGVMNLTSTTTASSTQNPLAVTGDFNNNSDGIVNADGSSSSTRVIYVYTGGVILNSGTLNLSNGVTGSRFYIRGTTTNYACGIINMNDGRILVNAETFTNNGFLNTTNTNASVTRISGSGTSINNAFAVSANAAGVWFTDGGSSGSGAENGITFVSGGTNFAVDAVNTCSVTDIGIGEAHAWYSDVAMTNLVGNNDAAGLLTINNNAYATSGPHTLYSCYGTDVTMTLTNLNGPCLPVELMSFEGIRKENIVELTWITASEENNYGFEIERAYENGAELEWELIDFIEGNGTTTDVQTYSYDDVQAFRGTNYYRLKTT